MSCCVVGCQNRSTKIKGLHFYRIPSGKRPFNANRRRLWLQAIKRVDWTEDIIKNARICGAHFISGEASLNYESPDFVPSVFEYSKSSQRPEAKLERFQRNKQRSKRSVKPPSPLTAEPCPGLSNMVKRCAYGTCKSDTRYPERLEGGVVFIAFPKPKTQEERCRLWIKQCGPQSQLNISKINKHTYVCSKHFVNGQPTPEYPNPVLAVQVPGQTRREQGGCRKPPTKRCRFSLQDASASTTIEAEEIQQCVVGSGKPSYLHHSTQPDWAPSLKLAGENERGTQRALYEPGRVMDGNASQGPEERSCSGEANGVNILDSGETTSKDDADGERTNEVSASEDLTNRDSSKGDTGNTVTPSPDETNGNDAGGNKEPKGDGGDSRTGGMDLVIGSILSGDAANANAASRDRANGDSPALSKGSLSSVVSSFQTGELLSSRDSAMTQEAASDSTPPEPHSHTPSTEQKPVARAKEDRQEEMGTEAMDVERGEQQDPQGEGSEGVAETSEGGKEGTKEVRGEEGQKVVLETGAKCLGGSTENLEGGAGDMEVDGKSGDSVAGVLEVPVISEIKEEISMDSEPSSSVGGDTNAYADLDMGVDMEMSTGGLDMGVETVATSQSKTSSETQVVHTQKVISVTRETDPEDLDMGVDTVMEDNTDSTSEGSIGDKSKRAASGLVLSQPQKDSSVGLKQENPDPSSDHTGSLKAPALPKQETSTLDPGSQDAAPAVELNLCIKDEPQDEEYDRALAPFNTEGIKDEPYSGEEFGQQKLSEQFKISAVFSVGQTSAVTAAKADVPMAVAPPKPTPPPSALPAQLPTPSTLCVVCSGCQKVLLKGQTAYQRKGSPQLYCSTSCLTGSTGTVLRATTKRTCHFCLKVISNPKDVIIAPVDKGGSVKDFCSQKCLSSFNYKRDSVLSTAATTKPASSVVTLASPAPSAPLSSSEPKARCSSCQKVVVSKHEVNYMGALHKLCSDECFTRFRSSNKLTMNCCSHCGSYCYQGSQGSPGHTLQIDRISKKFCSQACITAYRKKGHKTVPCAMCKATRPSSDMLEGVDSKGKTELFCSATCVTAQRVHTVSSAGTSLPCDKCSTTAVPQYHLAMSDGSIRNFCTFNCVLSFQDNFNKTNAQVKLSVTAAKSAVAPSTSAAPSPSPSPTPTPTPTPTPFQTMTPSSVKIGKVTCRHCNTTISSRPDPVEVKGKMFVLCGKQCAEDFRRMSLLPSRCDYCKVDKGVKEVKRVCGVDRLFCSEGCTLLYRHDLAKRWGRKHCRSCRYCGAISQVLVTSLFSGKQEEFCSHDCVSSYTLLFCQVAKCACCQRARAMSESLRWVGEMKHFCNLSCLLFFCYQHGSKEPINQVISAASIPAAKNPPVSKEATPIIANVISLSSTPNGQPSVLANPTLQGAVPNMPVKISGHASTQTDAVKAPAPPPPRVLKNKALLCKPLTQTKGTLCKPTYQTVETQTEQIHPTVLVVPIPVPVYVPVPMHLYSQYTPQPLGLPLPVPVPMFLPTTLDSAEQIVEAIQQIKEKIPADPLEADLILMAELVAEGNQKDEEETPVPSTSPADAPVGSPLPISDFDLDALGWGDDLLSAHTSDTPTSSLGPSLPETPEEHIDLEADIPVESLEMTAETVEPPGPPPSKRPRRKVRDAIPQKKRSLRKRPAVEPAVEPAVVPAPVGKLRAVYGVKAWKKWVLWRNAQPDVNTPRFGSRPMVLKEDLLQCSTAELSFGLCKFISEARRPHGEAYSPDSLYYLCLGIQQHLFENGRMENIFADFFYSKFTQEITKLLHDWSAMGTPGGKVRSRVEEEYLWECKQLGALSPSVLLYTLFFFCTKLFGLRTVQQHQRLSFAHVMRCTRTHKNGKAACLRFYPPINRKGSPTETLDCEGVSAKKRKVDEEEEPVLEMQENTENPLRCPIRIYEFYLSKCSPSVKQRTNVFYLQPERCCVPNSPMWFSSAPLEGDAMQAMLTRILTVRELHLPQEPSTQKPASSDEQDSD
ncbi:zinc finger MYM-type protein 4 isoform X3 [Clupea harengus]|uniref:Zinc finger MYM-type protein 4 isoform X3 n=1 Tax=Clupea harengus TaxID=7950 RepID=A0A8M1KV27_CLUHA|nr:zinc finger MYM-type protein 4 isoform X3 [Clupea harengus]